MRVLINRNYTWLWAGQAVSLIGDFVFDTTLLLWVSTVLLRGKDYAPAVSSAVLAVVALVTILAGPIAGVFVDRWDKKRTMLRTDLIRFVLIGGLTGVACLPAGTVPVPVTLVLICVTVAATTLAAQFFGPSRFVLMNDVVPGEQQGRAAGYGNATVAIAGILGPPLAAPLLVTAGVQWALGLNALSFLLSYAMIRLVKPPPTATAAPTRTTERPSVRADLLDGLRAVTANRVVLALLVTCMLVMLGAGAVNSLDVYFVQENLHAAPKWFGLLGAAFGAGSLVGALVGGFLGDRFGHARVLAGGIGVAGVFFVAYSRQNSIVPAIVVIVLCAVAFGMIDTVAGPLLMRSVPREQLGRVISFFAPANQLAQVVSIAVSGILVSTVLRDFHGTVAGVTFGRIDLIFGASGLLLLAGGVWAASALRGVDRVGAEPELVGAEKSQ